MGYEQFGGVLGPLRDPASGQMVQGNVQGTFEFSTQGDPAAVGQQLKQRLLHALNTVLGQKLASNQLAIPTIQMSLPALMPEIIQAAAAHELGAQLGNVQANVQMASPTAVQPPDALQAVAGNVADTAKANLDPRNYSYGASLKVGGVRLEADTEDGFDTGGLADQLKDKAKDKIIWWAIGCGVLLLVGAMLAAVAVYIVMKL